MGKHVIFGPPGTGKTTFGQGLVEEYHREGVRDDQIAFLAFNKEAAGHAADKCGIAKEDRRELWFRTIHSACYKLMGENKPKVLTNALKRQFSKEFGIELTIEGSADEESLESIFWDAFKATAPREDGDKYLQAYNMSRLCCRTEDELERIQHVQHPMTVVKGIEVLMPAAYQRFVETFEGFKAREGVIDFIDMLTRALTGHTGNPPEFRVAVIDEAQDLCPLMWAVAERLFFDADDLFLIGDDDQAIYSWMMSSADDFLAYREGAKIIVLDQTHRFGQEILDFSQKIASRLKRRHPKTIKPLAGAQHEIRTEFQFDPASFAQAVDGGTGLILHRHVRGCKELGGRLTRAGIPFWNERGSNPLGKMTEKNGYQAFMRLTEKGAISFDDLLSLIEVVPSRRSFGGETVTLVHHGSKKKVKEAFGAAVEKLYGPAELKEIFTDTFLQSVQERDPMWLGVDSIEYYQALVRNGYSLDVRPRINITTIHGAKGREADAVALFTEAYPVTLMNPDEHRVPYVGVTRTRGDLWLVREPLCGDWTREYPYPEV